MSCKAIRPPARFEASKLKVVFVGEQVSNQTRVVPRTYTLSHCDFTADLTLTVSNIIPRDQLKGWYSKDDVVAEWTNVNGEPVPQHSLLCQWTKPFISHGCRV
ncbi:magnesium dechelatase SGRL, chloroplastic-like [Salvia splendens]|uniref:magnesium dechelatase SGRL, chloroplastic-like n=1 Tax=Salvia splendens TaxID=180675 RepID=UPI001C2737FB|nr:magnesium dechelatase SGRL, chloroplastic-like [Salvia splendens]